MSINRKIYVLHRTSIAPINLVYGSDAADIELELMDFTLASTATATAYASVRGSGEVYKTACTVTGNTVTLTPELNLFQPGENDLQVVITTGGTLVSFAIPVMCDNNLSVQGATEASTVPTMVQLTARVEALETEVADAHSVEGTLYRYGGDEFTISYEDANLHDAIGDVITQLGKFVEDDIGEVNTALESEVSRASKAEATKANGTGLTFKIANGILTVSYDDGA